MIWTTEHWARIEELFHAAADLPAERRLPFLHESCGGDRRLLAEVEHLLAADGNDHDEWIERGVDAALPDPLLGTNVGSFVLMERVAEGGMGAVYRARRTGVDFEQVVAVKVLRLSLRTTAMGERFARERQTLARLVHPNVARLLDGGTTTDGLPYFAMEFVDGVAIDRYADSRRLGVRERLRLFAVVCRAVQFAHQSLVVHLDLKPSNILVDDHGTPKLLDFGVAAMLGELAPASAEAATTRPLTPEYASPEQLRGDAVGTAADVYGLGVVLFELLAGIRPGAAPTARASSAYDTHEPARRASAVDRAAARSSAPRRLQRALAGDLDRIVARATAADPSGRYASCRELADDVERFLGGYPVQANPLGHTRRVLRFVRRNALFVGSATAVVSSLVAGIVATMHMAAVARVERDEAAAARVRSELAADHASVEATSGRIITEFFADTLLSSDTLRNGPDRARVLATLEHRAEQARRQFEGSPHLCANVLHALGSACVDLDAFEAAEKLLREAGVLREKEFGPRSLEVALSRTAIGRLRYKQGRFAEAAEAFAQAYRLHCECPTDVHTDVAQAANDLAAAERALGRAARACELNRQALALRRAGGDEVLIAESLNNLAAVEPDRTAARGHLAEALQLRERVLGPEHPLTIQCEVNLGVMCLNEGDFGRARDLLAAALQQGRELAQAGDDAVAMAARSLAYAELRLGDLPAADAAVTDALRLEQSRFGSEHPRVAAVLEVRASIEERRGQWPTAVATWREVVRVREKTLPDGALPTLLARQSLGNALVRTGDAAEAADLLALVVTALEALGPAVEQRLAGARVSWALALETGGDLVAAERQLVAAVRAVPSGATDGSAQVLEQHLRDFYLRHDRPADAERILSARAAGK